MDFRHLIVETTNINLTENDTRCIIRFSGHLVEYDAFILRTNIETWLDPLYSEYTFDLSILDSIDIAGVNVLVQIKKYVEENQSTCIFIVPYKKDVLETIYLTKLALSLNIEYFLDDDYLNEN